MPKAENIFWGLAIGAGFYLLLGSLASATSPATQPTPPSAPQAQVAVQNVGNPQALAGGAGHACGGANGGCGCGGGRKINNPPGI